MLLLPDHIKAHAQIVRAALYFESYETKLHKAMPVWDSLVTLAGYYIHSTLVPVIVPKCFFPPSEEIDVKDSFLSNGRGRVG